MSLDRPVGIVGPLSPDASLTYRILLLMIRGLGRGVFGFRTEVLGTELLPRDASDSPAGGWIAAGLPHRTWVDPFVVADNLPIEPRLVFFGDGRAMFRSRSRRWVFRRIGGVIPIWPGGGRAAIDAHLSAASQALAAGAVLCLFPETGPATSVNRIASDRSSSARSRRPRVSRSPTPLPRTSMTRVRTRSGRERPVCRSGSTASLARRM